jgi:hypothetical protein
MTRRIHCSVETVLRAMRGGAVLQLSFEDSQTWALDGVPVARDIAKQIVARRDVFGSGHTLFAGLGSQTYRHVGEKQG